MHRHVLGTSILPIAILLAAYTPQTGGQVATQPTTVAATPAGTTPTVTATTPGASSSPTTAPAGNSNAQIVSAAIAFLNSLDATQKSKAVYKYSNTTAKAQWSNLPAGLFTWSGVRMGDLTANQKHLLTATLRRKGSPWVMDGGPVQRVLPFGSRVDVTVFGLVMSVNGVLAVVR